MPKGEKRIDSYGKKWEFYIGERIYTLTPADFDGDGIREDVALISGNAFFAYDRALLYLPALTINKSASVVNESVNVTLVVKNTGDGIARDVKLFDSIPRGWEVLAGKTSWRGDLSPGKKVAISYLLMPPSPGNHTLPGVEASYYDKYGRSYRVNSSSVELSIPEKKAEKQEENKTSAEESPPPVLIVDRDFEGNLTKGGNVTINVLLRNIGGSTAFVSFEMAVPEGVELDRSRWEGEVKKRGGGGYQLPPSGEEPHLQRKGDSASSDGCDTQRRKRRYLHCLNLRADYTC